MKNMYKIKITKGKGWYKNDIGKIFYVINETDKVYIVDRGGGCFSFVEKSNAEHSQNT